MPDTNPEATDVTESADRKSDVVRRLKPGAITDLQTKNKTVTFYSENDIRLHVTVHTAEIIQLQYKTHTDLQSDFSYAIDPDFQTGNPDFKLEETDQYFEISTESIVFRITREAMKVHFMDREGNTLCEDKDGYFRRDSVMKGISEVKVTHNAPKGASYFGLGDKADSQDLRGKKFENWNTDAYAYERGDDPLYRSIPFYAVLNKGRAYGIFLDNTYRTHFDFDSGSKKVSSFSAEGGVMNYYFIYGPELTTVSERYAQLTGTPELPPLWALGYHQCRWSYCPESRVREIARAFREKKIPCDAIYLDIDYLDGYRSFTWNNEQFPNPKKLIADLKEQGFKTIAMIDPGIKVDPGYPVYDQGLENDYFCRRPDGELMTAKVWPLESAFPDYTHPEVRNWWADWYEDLMANKEIDGIWNDMNEPAVFEVKHKTLPDDIRHHFEGQPCSHRKAHNIYGMQMSRASHQGIKKHNDRKRPFLLTRANFAGGQRYSALWTGDNIANWDHLKLANQQCQRLSISGYSFVGTDIGGFVKQPSAELFSRWLQLGIFHPLFRNHTMGYNVDGASAIDEESVQQKKKETTADQEPWTFGEKFTRINRSVIELRYRLLHYLYTTFWQYVENGTPILRPLSYYDQNDKMTTAYDNEFLFGDHILVSPALNKNQRSVKTYFPEGRWYDFRTNKCYQGKKAYKIDAPLSDIPFFVKAGTILPLREIMQYSGEWEPDTLELNIYYGESESSSFLYEDAGEGYDHKDGDYRLAKFRAILETSKKKLIVEVDRQGDYVPTYTRIKLNIIGFPFKCREILVDGNTAKIAAEHEDSRTVYSAEVEAGFKKMEITG